MIDGLTLLNKALSEERERQAIQIAQWRRDGRCTECGCVLVGDADVLDATGVRYFGGAPHLIGDRVCFWCIFEDGLPSQHFQWGRA